MTNIQVALGDRTYSIEIGTGILAFIGERMQKLAKGKQVAVITDDIVAGYYGKIVVESLEQAGYKVELMTITHGENSKSWQNAEHILAQLLAHQYHRDCSIVALGGGVVGDLAGFIASIYQRGVNFFQIPTTLLAQVDSSVGGKVAVNHKLGKNMIGSFYQPKAVWIDLDTLKTLEPRQWANGMAEVIKYGIIMDPQLLDFLEIHQKAINQKNTDEIADMIGRCCRLKADIVAQDEKETGVRAILNFGHTIGHGIEKAGAYYIYLHGEAIAIGMVLATKLAMKYGMVDDPFLRRLRCLLTQYGLPTDLPKELSYNVILKAMALDKKVSNDQWVFVLPSGIGQVKLVSGIEPSTVEDILKA